MDLGSEEQLHIKLNTPEKRTIQASTSSERYTEYPEDVLIIPNCNKS